MFGKGGATIIAHAKARQASPPTSTCQGRPLHQGPGGRGDPCESVSIAAARARFGGEKTSRASAGGAYGRDLYVYFRESISSRWETRRLPGAIRSWPWFEGGGCSAASSIGPPDDHRNEQTRIVAGSGAPVSPARNESRPMPLIRCSRACPKRCAKGSRRKTCRRGTFSTACRAPGQTRTSLSMTRTRACGRITTSLTSDRLGIPMRT